MADEEDEPAPAPIVKREPTTTSDKVGELDILEGVTPRRMEASTGDATKNSLVSRGVSGADTLGLRQTELANQAVGLRGSGTKAERIAALKKSTGLDQLAEAGGLLEGHAAALARSANRQRAGGGGELYGRSLGYRSVTVSR